MGVKNLHVRSERERDRAPTQQHFLPPCRREGEFTSWSADGLGRRSRQPVEFVASSGEDGINGGINRMQHRPGRKSEVRAEINGSSRGIRTDGLHHPHKIYGNDKKFTLCAVFFSSSFVSSPVTVSCALASTGWAVLRLLCEASHTYRPESEEEAAGTTKRCPVLSWRPSRFHVTTRPSSCLGGEEKEQQE